MWRLRVVGWEGWGTVVWGVSNLTLCRGKGFFEMRGWMEGGGYVLMQLR